MGKLRLHHGLKPRQYFDLKVEPGMRETFERIGFRDGIQPKAYFQMCFNYFEYFLSIDTDNSGEIGFGEFYRFFKIQKETKFVERLFGYFDLDRSRQLSFQEFVIGTWNFCTLSDLRLAKFAMDIFDVEGTAEMNMYKVDALVRMIHGTEETPNEFVDSIEALSMPQNEHGTMDIYQFGVYLASNEKLFAPVKQIQKSVRRKLFGETFWIKRTRARSEVYGEFETAENILLKDRKKALAEMRKFKNEKRKTAKSSRIMAAMDQNSTVGLLQENSSGAHTGSTGISQLIADFKDEEKEGEEGEEDEEDPDNIYDRQSGKAKSDTEQAALEAYLRMKKYRAAYQIYQHKYRELQINMYGKAPNAGISLHSGGSSASTVDVKTQVSKEQLDEEEKLVLGAAKAKQEFLTCANFLEHIGLEALEEVERTKYLWCINEAESRGAVFFKTKEGKGYLKVVGREHAHRDFKPEGLFGTLTRKQVDAGKKKARNEYIARKAKEMSREVTEEFGELKAKHRDLIHRIYTAFNLYTHDNEKIISMWQWQKLKDSETGKFYFHVPGIDATLWTEPYLMNVSGLCEDSSCQDIAVIRCAKCAREYCAACEQVIHAYGPARNHFQKTSIPQEEVHWRQAIQDLDPKMRKDLCASICVDPIEQARRHMLEEARREREMLRASQEDTSMSFSASKSSSKSTTTTPSSLLLK